MTRQGSAYALSLLLLFAFGCAGAPSPTEGEGEKTEVLVDESGEPVLDESGEPVLVTKSEAATARAKAAENDDGWVKESANAVAISHVQLSGDLVLTGFSDGTVGRVAAKEGHLTRVSEVSSPISAISPDGTLAFVSGAKLLVNTKKKAILARLESLGEVESARFSGDGRTFVVAEKGGKVHIWAREKLKEGSDGELLHQFLARTQPDFTAQLPPVRGPVAIQTPERIFFGDKSGRVHLLDVKNAETTAVMRLKQPVRTLEVGPEHVVATSVGGQLGVGSISPPQFLKWSLSEESDAAVLTYKDQVVTIRGDKMSLRSLKSGDVVWEKSLPSGDNCGVSMGDGKIAVCRNNRVGVLNLKDGKIVFSFVNDGGKLRHRP